MLHLVEPWRSRQYWNLLVTLNVAYVAVITPLQAAFEEDMGSNWDAIDFTMDVIFLLDVALVFNKAIKQQLQRGYEIRSK